MITRTFGVQSAAPCVRDPRPSDGTGRGTSHLLRGSRSGVAIEYNRGPVPRVLVTGGAGFIGSHLARSLLADGWDVEIADDLSTGSELNLPDAPLHRVDLGRPEALAALPQHGFDAIAHLAGQSSGEKSFDDPVRDFDANARSTLLLAEWALRHDVPVFVHASSMGVYGQPDAAPVAEDAPLRALSWYGASKRAAEGALEIAAGQGMRTVSLRMFSIYGPGQDLREMRQGIVSIFLAMLLRGEEVVVHGPLERVRDFVFVEDCVAAWRAALEREDARGPINVGTGIGTTVGELVAQLVDVVGLPAEHPVRSHGTTPGDQTALFADTARARELLGFEARTPLRDGLEAMLAWARDA
jgi:UDP-glucose 4-epimerase